MKKWITIFPECMNFHLIKDVGYIPYMMNKEFDYESYVVTYKNDEYKYLDNELKGLKIKYLNNRIKNDKIAVIYFLIKNAKNIDVLNLYHLKPKNLIYFFIYKKLNKKGKTYLKLDANIEIKNISLDGKSLKEKIYNRFIKYCDYISVETTELKKWLNNNWKVNVGYIPNGFWINENHKRKEKKKNITTVARLGAEYKNSEDIIKAFLNIYHKIPGWKLVLVGSMTKEFEEYYIETLKKNPEIKELIMYKGEIRDLDKLDDIYAESKIFCLTSSSESFGLVFVEALKNGCYIVTSDVLAANDVTNSGIYGSIFKSRDLKQLEKILIEKCNDSELEKMEEEIRNFAFENFEWENICRKIVEKLGEEKTNGVINNNSNI